MRFSRCLAMIGVSVWMVGSLTSYAKDPSAEDWYRTSYAPLWEVDPYAQVEAMLSHYAPLILTHSAEGGFRSDAREPWLKAPLMAWQAEGWLRSELVDLQTQMINPSTATFLASWRDIYASGDTELSCGWYLAGRDGGAWQFTAYADAPCP